MNKTLITGALALTLMGCGGGGGGSTSTPTTTTPPVTETPTTPTTPVVLKTEDLVADSNFDFRIDMDLTLILEQLPQYQGMVNVYYDYEHHDVVNDIYYPNYETRVLSFSPQVTTNIEFQVSKNWQQLVVEFVPTQAEGVEMYKKLDLSNNTTLGFSFN